MSALNSQTTNQLHQPPRPHNPTAILINSANETPILCDIKLLCTQRKKRSKRHVYLNFVDSCSLPSSSNEQPCIEIIDRRTYPAIPLNECISLEYFDTVANDFQSFIYIYFQSYTISIYFSNEDLPKKTRIIKHLEYMYQKPSELFELSSASSDSACLSTTEYILHTFDVKLIPYESIISRNHILIGPARLYFTGTDLYVASIDCNRVDLRKTLINQCPLKDQVILCIPYFTIKQYGNRANIFLIELGKSNYGNGEVHMQCVSSLLASTIHLLASPVIEERPSIFPSTLQHQSLADKRMAKSKSIQPPIKLCRDTTDQFLPFLERPSIQSLPETSSETKKVKTPLLVSFFRKLVHNNLPIHRSSTYHTNEYPLNQQPNSSPRSTNKFFELNIERKRSPSRPHPITTDSSSSTLDSNSIISRRVSFNTHEAANGTYIDMVPNVKELNPQAQVIDEVTEEVKETAATTDIGVNTTITLPPSVRSAIFVGDTVHLIAEESAVHPIGQRSFTSPASVMQPFKAQLFKQTASNTLPTTTGMITCAGNSSSSFHQPLSTYNSQQSLLLSYGIVTFNNNNLSSNHQHDRSSSPMSDESILDRRLNSDFSVMSLSHQQQPANIYSFDGILSSSPSSHIFRTYSVSTADSTSGPMRTPNGSILYFDEMTSEHAKTYLLEPPPLSSMVISDMNRAASLSRSFLPSMNEEKVSFNDAYALTEPLSSENVSSIFIKPFPSAGKSVHYTDVLFSTNTGDKQEAVDSTDENIDLEERTDRSTTLVYSDIDFHQTQRRDRLAQLSCLPNSADQTAPFIL